MTATSPATEPLNVFQIGSVTYDQSTLELYVDGQRRPIEAKPRALLQSLLANAGILVTKRELIEAAWGNADHISETSLTTAMSKLRAALGGNGRSLIDGVHGVGYRIAGPVVVSPARGTTQPAFTFAVNDAVPGRPGWHLRRLLGSSLLNDVWLSCEDTTQETRVLKFARTERRFETLKRELAASRALQAALGERHDLLPIVDWKFDEPPFFIETPYGGQDLLSWIAARGGLAAFAMAQRLAMVTAIARTIDAAHGAGIVHGDLKPSNILVGELGGDDACLRVVDFGAGGLSDTVRLETLGITLDDLEDSNRNRAGSLGYIAPEILAGGTPTKAADVYALAVLLYQFVVADFGQSLHVGWEEGVADELVRQDIAEAASGAPLRRMASAATLAGRLETLPARAENLRQRRHDAARMADLARQVERERLRRPWMVALLILMISAVTATTWFGLRATRERDHARQNAALMQAVNAFLTEDLLGRGDPARSGKPDESLMQAAEAAERAVDRRFGTEPMEAGAIYLSLAHAYESRSAYDDARRAYKQAAAWFGSAGANGRAEAAIAALRQAGMEAASGQAGSLPRARILLNDAAPRVDGLGARREEARVFLSRALAGIDTVEGNQLGAEQNLRRAIQAAESMPSAIDESMRLALKLDLSTTYIHLAKWQAAEALLAKVLQRERALNGPDHAETLRVELKSAEVRVAQGDLAGALADLDRLSPRILTVFGSDHRVTLTLLAMRADVLSRSARYNEALSAQSAIYSTVVRLDGPRSWTALGTLTNTAQTRCRANQIESGLNAAQTAYLGARDAFGDNHILTQAAAGNLAFCLVLDHQYAPGLALLQRIDAKTVGEATRDPTYQAELDVMRADIAFATGNAVQGRSLIRESAPVFEQPGADAYMQNWERRLSNAIFSDRLTAPAGYAHSP
jgi:non-specific serine/threonine protein kinase